MNYLMSSNLTPVEISTWVYIVLYGFFYGLGNLYTLLLGVVTGRGVIQSFLGKCLDKVWYIVIGLNVTDIVMGY